MGDITVHQAAGGDDWSTGILECCGGDGYGKGGDSAGATVCEYANRSCARFGRS